MVINQMTAMSSKFIHLGNNYLLHNQGNKSKKMTVLSNSFHLLEEVISDAEGEEFEFKKNFFYTQKFHWQNSKRKILCNLPRTL